MRSINCAACTWLSNRPISPFLQKINDSPSIYPLMDSELQELVESFKQAAIAQRSNPSSSAQSLAIRLFFKGAELERAGDFGRAIEMYNRAYKLDPEVESHFTSDQLHEYLKERSQKADQASNEDSIYNPFSNNDNKTLSAEDSQDLCSQIAASQIASSSLLDELPEDVLLKVLQYLGRAHLPSLESVVARSCKKLYLACRKDSLWQGISRLKSLNVSSRAHFIKSSQLRTDGLYIAKITYIRQGWEEGVTNPPSFVVTYYRYLRFFPQHRVVVGLVTTEAPGSSIIERLKAPPADVLQAIKQRFFQRQSNSKKKTQPSTIKIDPNLFIGAYWPDPNYPLPDPEDNTDNLFLYRLVLFDAHSANPMRLQMIMGVPGGARWSRCLGYAGRVEYFQLDGGRKGALGERVDFDVHSWGKFYFSRVKRYHE